MTGDAVQPRQVWITLFLYVQDDDSEYAAIRQARMSQDSRPKYRRRTVSGMQRSRENTR